MLSMPKICSNIAPLAVGEWCGGRSLNPDLYPPEDFRKISSKNAWKLIMRDVSETN